MRHDQLNSIYDYFDGYIRNCHNVYPDKISFDEPSWETLMTLLNCIEANYHEVRFQFHKNCFRIEYSGDGNGRAMQDKGSNLKEAIILCCFRFLSERDKNAPSLNLPNDDFLLDD